MTMPAEPTTRTWRVGHQDGDDEHIETTIEATHAVLTKPEGGVPQALSLYNHAELVAIFHPRSWRYAIATEAEASE